MLAAEAQQVAQDLQDRYLLESALGRMAEWVASGAPPAADDLRASGFAKDLQDPQLRIQLNLARKAFIREWGFSIPGAEAVAALAALGPLVEIGAGSGYWTAILQAAGHDVIATDPTAAGDIGYGFEAGRHCAVEPLTAKAALARHPDRDVFCSWPTQNASWALGAAWQMRPSQRLALIEGRVTGSPGLRRYLATRFDIEDEVAIPQFPGCDDALRIYRKR